MLCVHRHLASTSSAVFYYGFRFTTAYNAALLSSAWRWGFLSYTSSSSPVINKLRRLPATSVNKLPWSVAAVYIASAAPTVHSTRWSQILVQNRDFCIPHLYSTSPLGASPSEYCHDVWYGKKNRIIWLPDGEKILKILYFSFRQNSTWQTDRRTPHDKIGRN